MADFVNRWAKNEWATGGKWANAAEYVGGKFGNRWDISNFNRNQTLSGLSIFSNKLLLSDDSLRPNNNKNDSWDWLTVEDWWFKPSNWLPPISDIRQNLSRLDDLIRKNELERIWNEEDRSLSRALSLTLPSPFRNTDYYLKVELNWRLKQFAGAIWENNSLINVFNILRNGKMPAYRIGLKDLEVKSRNKEIRNLIMKEDADRTAALFLYDFAVGRANNETKIDENSHFVRMLNEHDYLIDHVINDIKRRGYSFDETFGIIELLEKSSRNVFSGIFGFSPGDTTLLDSWHRHVYAITSNIYLLIVGGMTYTMKATDNDEVEILFYNEMGLYSLFYHLLPNIKAPGPLYTQKHLFNYIRNASSLNSRLID